MFGQWIARKLLNVFYLFITEARIAQSKARPHLTNEQKRALLNMFEERIEVERKRKENK